jgi:hypothetical protein
MPPKSPGGKPSRRKTGQDRDQDRPDVDEHRRSAGVHVPLGSIEGHAVDPEPRHAVDRNREQIAPGRQRLSAGECDRTEDGAAHDQAAKRERAR